MPVNTLDLLVVAGKSPVEDLATAARGSKTGRFSFNAVTGDAQSAQAMGMTSTSATKAATP